MARHRREEATVALFPFLSILICMMGILAFIMVSTAMVSAARPKVQFEFEGTHTKRPIFVECHKEGPIVHPERLQMSLQTMQAVGSPFMQLLDRVGQRKNEEYILFIIYPDGIACFQRGRNLIQAQNATRGLAKSQGIELGFEPFLEGWQLPSAQTEQP